MLKENKFQASLIKEIQEQLPGCIILKNNASDIQGIPDLIILHKKKWAALETKRYIGAGKRPNQEYYLNKLNSMSYASFVYPENKQEVLHELANIFTPRRTTRISKC